MKKIVPILVLLVLLSLAAFADDGTTHSGGKTCPQGQTCLVAPTDSGTNSKTVFTKMLDLLKNVFG
jgi:hypothetical protein